MCSQLAIRVSTTVAAVSARVAAASSGCAVSCGWMSSSNLTCRGRPVAGGAGGGGAAAGAGVGVGVVLLVLVLVLVLVRVLVQVLRSIVTLFRAARNTFWLLSKGVWSVAALRSGRGGAPFVVERGGSWSDLGVVEVRCGRASMFFKCRDEQHANPEISW